MHDTSGSVKIYFVTVMGMLNSHQEVIEAIDLHDLCVDKLQIVPPITGHEYSDKEIISILSNKELWDDQRFYLVSIYDPTAKTLQPIIVDHNVSV